MSGLINSSVRFLTLSELANLTFEDFCNYAAGFSSVDFENLSGAYFNGVKGFHASYDGDWSILPPIPVNGEVYQQTEDEILGMFLQEVSSSARDPVLLRASYDFAKRLVGNSVSSNPTIESLVETLQADSDELKITSTIDSLFDAYNDQIRAIVTEVGALVWCKYVGTRFQIQAISNQGKGFNEANLQKHTLVLDKMCAQFTEDQLLSFYFVELKGAAANLIDDVFVDLSRNLAYVTRVANNLIYAANGSVYDFGELDASVGNESAYGPNFVDSRRGKLERCLTKYRIAQRYNEVKFSKTSLVGIYATLYHKGYKSYKDGNFVVIAVHHPIIKTGSTGLSLIESDRQYLIPYVELSLSFKNARASSAVGYVASEWDKFGVPQLLVGKTEVSILQMYVETVGYNPSQDKCGYDAFVGFGLALQRARWLRESTMMDKEYKQTFQLVQLGDEFYENYDADVVRVLHLVAKFKKSDMKRMLIVLDSNNVASSIISMVSTIRCDKLIKFMFLDDVPTNARSFTFSTDPLIIFKDGAVDWLRAESSLLCWLCMPSGGTDYFQFGKSKQQENIHYQALVGAAQRVQKLIAFSSRSFEIVCRPESFKFLTTDVVSPYSTYFTNTGKVINIENKYHGRVLVPLGHAPHTAQRIVEFEVGDGILRYTSPLLKNDRTKLQRAQVEETLAFSQNRWRMVACYVSEEILELGLKRVKQNFQATGSSTGVEF
jgi:hypothetical protein